MTLKKAEKLWTFPEILKKAPAIHVCKISSFYEIKTEILTPTAEDKKYSKMRFSNTSKVAGLGSLKYPRCFLNDSPISAHYAIVNLWFDYRRPLHKDVYIRVG